jgi:predicted TIM-barrel fold metal-dependent hydrolase
MNALTDSKSISGPTAGAPACAAPDFFPRKPKLVLPAGACDCHAHILGPAAEFAYAPERIYTPPDCLLGDYQTMLNTLGLERAVLVQPSVYGTDNRVMLRALRVGGSALRGVAVVDARVSEAELNDMHQAGVRGVRVNVVDVKEGKGALPLAELRYLAQRVAPLGWHMEFLMHVNEHPDLDQAFADFPVQVVLGHLGYMPTSQGLQSPGFQALLRLLNEGRTWVKLTGPYRISSNALPYSDVKAFAQALLQTAPDRVLWGSDWPHVMLKGTMPNDADLLDLLGSWIPDEEDLQKVLVSNPRRLYGF